MSPRLSETARRHGQTSAPPWWRLPAGQPGLPGRCSGLALGHGHGHHLHLLGQLGGRLLRLLLPLLPLLSFFLTADGTEGMQEKLIQRAETERQAAWDSFPSCLFTVSV